MDGRTDIFMNGLLLGLEFSVKPTRVTHEYVRTDGRTDGWADGGVTISILLFQKKKRGLF